MSNLFRSFCSEIGTALEDCLSKYLGQHHFEWARFLPLAIMAYRSSIHTVTRNSRVYVILGFPLSQPIGCIYNTPQNAVYATSSDVVFTMVRIS